MFFCLDRLISRGGRSAYHGVRTQNTPDDANRQILLSDMSAVGTDGLCQIDTIVYQQGNTHVPAYLRRLSSGYQEVAVKTALLTKLNRVGTATNRKFGQGGVRVALLEMEICENVEPAEPSLARLCA